MKFLLITLCFSLIAHDFVGSQRSNQQAKVLRHILQDYDNRIRPVVNDIDALNVTLAVYARDLYEPETVGSNLHHVRVFLSQSWADEFLEWDPKQFGGVERIRVNRNLIWTPDITAFSGKMEPADTHSPEKAIVSNDGRVRLYLHRIVAVPCKSENGGGEGASDGLSGKRVKCIATFGSWVHPEQELNLQILKENISLSRSAPGSQWQLSGYDAIKLTYQYPHETSPFPKIRVSLEYTKDVN